MKYEQAGTYEIEYKAVDECGNETTATRTIEVIDNSLHTVLFSDGTLIINERASNRESDLSEYGFVLKEYDPLDENNGYDFNGASARPWNAQANDIKAVKFGSEVAPVSIAYWLQSATNLESIDWTNFNGSNVTSARAFVASTKIKALTMPEMPKLSNIRFMCNKCATLESADFSKMKSTAITDMVDIFQGCYALKIVDFSSNSGTVATSDRAFANVNSDGMGDMKIETIYADEGLDFSKATSSANMFRTCTSLVGGNGTTFNSSYIDKTYARIDKAGTPGYFTEKE